MVTVAYQINGKLDAPLFTTFMFWVSLSLRMPKQNTTKMTNAKAEYYEPEFQQRPMPPETVIIDRHSPP